MDLSHFFLTKKNTTTKITDIDPCNKIISTFKVIYYLLDSLCELSIFLHSWFWKIVSLPITGHSHLFYIVSWNCMWISFLLPPAISTASVLQTPLSWWEFCIQTLQRPNLQLPLTSLVMWYIQIILRSKHSSAQWQGHRTSHINFKSKTTRL